MLYIEMSREEAHGGGTWGFPNCVWAPTRKKKGAGTWPFWNKVADLRPGDVVLHLRGKLDKAHFVGFSNVAAPGFETFQRPPEPGEWGYSESFYRADLEGFTVLHEPVNLRALFRAHKDDFIAYFEKNKKGERRNIFYVLQAGRLQCLNGAYLSDVDEELFNIMFPDVSQPSGAKTREALVSVPTGTQLRTVRARIGQREFADAVKSAYGNACCIPGCSVADPRFLVGAHIARWSDSEALRGNIGNGLCLCLVHDRAFELGLFTLDEAYQVVVNPREIAADTPMCRELRAVEGLRIRAGSVPPLSDALLEHWVRVDIVPWERHESSREARITAALG
jgi:putative restriction endonuclease